METIKKAQAILDYIAEKAGIDRFEFDEEGKAFFNANDLSFLFYAMEDEKLLVTSIYIGQPDVEDSDFLFNVLCGNHLWEFTGGGNLSIDRETGHLCLSHQMELPIEEMGDVEHMFANLLGAAEYWKDILVKMESGAGPDAGDVNSQHFIRI